MIKIVFFGTPDYVLPILKALSKRYEIVGVVTQEPKLSGRKQIKTYSQADNWAHKHRIAVFYEFEKVPKADLGIVAAFGKIIPKFVIEDFKFGILNIHPSLLPKYRGASPVQDAIIAGDTETGVTIIKMDEEMDHGPIISQFKEDVLPQDTTETLRVRLFARSAEVLLALIEHYLQGKITPRAQNESEATYTKIITKEDGVVDLEKDPSVQIERKLRAYTPWPGIWTLLRSSGASEVHARRLKILKAHLDAGKLILDEVQLEGKNPVSWTQFTQAYPKLEFYSSK